MSASPRGQAPRHSPCFSVENQWPSRSDSAVHCGTSITRSTERYGGLVRRRFSFEFDIETGTGVRFGIKTVGTLGFAVDNRIQSFSDSAIDNAFELAGFGTELFDAQHVDKKAFDDTVRLQGVAGPNNPFVSEADSLAGLTSSMSATRPVAAGLSSCC